MSDLQPNPHRLDVRTFARSAGLLQGQLPLTGLQRLALSLLPSAPGEPPPPPVTWRAEGTQRQVSGGEPELWLALQANAQVVLECQRCLQPLMLPLAVDRRFRFVPGEDEAARIDEDSDDDVLALPTSLNLPDFIEDELILALPLVPRHETCPQPLVMSAADPEALAEDDEPHPFAALAALRRQPPLN